MSFDALRIGARSQPTSYVEPIRVWKIQHVRRTVNRSSGLDRDPKDRHAFHPVTVESRRHDSHHSYRLTVERKSASDHRWIAAILLLPCRIAHHCNGSCSVSVILHGESATGIGTDA